MLMSGVKVVIFVLFLAEGSLAGELEEIQDLKRERDYLF